MTKRGGDKAARRPSKALVGHVLPPEEGGPVKKKRGPAKGTPGEPPHKPTDRDRQIVEAMSSYGIPQGAIARLIGGGISEPTLQKHYRAELDSAQDKLTAKLNEALVAQALGHPAVYDDQGRLIRAEQKRYAPAAMWLLRRQDYLEDRRLERAARAQEAARQALRDRLKIVFEMATADEIEVVQRVFGRVAERLAEVGRL